ncbi:carbohydrate kinase family protein [Haloarchaeobius iranensis]|uniref:Fructokinase n=1 Tax=Haloarchaeobius iranensis TaxID=996166 RepID=A0A1G9UCZ2_9EURY|nr:carbohydrate kinase [Haloarchaeobius iranensis]SDM57837.1 fructokinase [Haloarchaeobius iranensis]
MTDHHVLVAGETLVDFLPTRPGPLSTVETFDRRPGGAPANVAVGLARLGHTPLFWTRVGADQFGAFLADTLADEGVPGRFVERDSGAKTTLAFVTHDESGDRAFTFYRDGIADTRFEPGTVPDDTLAAVDRVVCGGVPLATGRSRAAMRDLLERARAAGEETWFDPNYRPELWPADDFGDVVGGALAHVDVLKATERELRALDLAGDSPREFSTAATGRGPHTVLVTLGGDGALADATADAPWGPATVEHGGYDVDVVDTTGAGDAFFAGAVARATAGDDSLESVLSYANAVAAVATTARGAMAALPSHEAVVAMQDSA